MKTKHYALYCREIPQEIGFETFRVMESNSLREIRMFAKKRGITGLVIARRSILAIRSDGAFLRA
jgi:hypothetical protein